MGTLKVDTITDEAGSGAPDFTNGLTRPTPKSMLYRLTSTVVGATSGVNNTIVFDDVVFDTFEAADYNESTGIFTVPETGLYTITNRVAIDDNNGSGDSISRFINRMQLDGSDYTRFNDLRLDAGGLQTAAASGTVTVSLTAGDEISIAVFGITATTYNIASGVAGSWLNITRIA